MTKSSRTGSSTPTYSRTLNQPLDQRPGASPVPAHHGAGQDTGTQRPTQWLGDLVTAISSGIASWRFVSDKDSNIFGQGDGHALTTPPIHVSG